MCNLDSIYALIVLESASSRKRPLGSTRHGSQSEAELGNGLDACMHVFQTAHHISSQAQYVLSMPGVLR